MSARGWTSASVTAATPLWIAARQLLQSHSREFFRHWVKVAKRFEAEEIHDLRVASRRLREALALFEPCFPGKSLKQIGKQVKQVTDILGELRNTDEALLFFDQLTDAERGEAQPELEALLAHLGQERRAARKLLERDLRALKPKPLKKELEEVLAKPRLFANPHTDPLQPIGSFAETAIVTRALPISQLLPPAREEADAAAQHRLRIATKRMRYRLEILEPLFRCDYEELHAALKGYQEVLGKLHDLDVFSGLLLERTPPGAGQQDLLRAIASRRSKLHADFLVHLETLSIDAIGNRARRAL
jgi:CHAD domain-containing protein